MEVYSVVTMLTKQIVTGTTVEAILSFSFANSEAEALGFAHVNTDLQERLRQGWAIGSMKANVIDGAIRQNMLSIWIGDKVENLESQLDALGQTLQKFEASSTQAESLWKHISNTV